MSRKRRLVADEPFLVIRAAASDLAGGQVIARHAHDWHQLIYASAGVMTVTTEAGSWVVPPNRAVWVPAGIRHAIRFAGQSRFRTLYMMPGWSERLPGTCLVVAVSPLLSALVVRAAELRALDRRDCVEGALAVLIVDEFRQAAVPPFSLPQPESEAARRAAVLIADGASEAGSVATLAQAVGLGARTLERRFRDETGMTLGRWRRHHALLGALEQVAGGAPVKAAAAAAGYAAPSAFVAAFRAAFGTTPGRYFEA
ncbi:MAG: helix-turn-helix protein AraC type [Sphingomonas bacterium]|uniref:AraC family transcriptional regulator n=1 Tax=Sphingomonas bacterium TaxID=1895847 RepID=UPI0026203725|nr:helix-turn-helix transcriptional regulator [Sphingomonas bacterium]MDB5710573.1 helix-turn-helix protein AraC type [Sphingomonas bacterium]